MTKKDYIIIAEALRNFIMGSNLSHWQQTRLADSLINEFEKDNKRFDKVKFFQSIVD